MHANRPAQGFSPRRSATYTPGRSIVTRRLCGVIVVVCRRIPTGGGGQRSPLLAGTRAITSRTERTDAPTTVRR